MLQCVSHRNTQLPQNFPEFHYKYNYFNSTSFWSSGSIWYDHRYKNMIGVWLLEAVGDSCARLLAQTVPENRSGIVLMWNLIIVIILSRSFNSASKAPGSQSWWWALINAQTCLLDARLPPVSLLPDWETCCAYSKEELLIQRHQVISPDNPTSQSHSA